MSALMPEGWSEQPQATSAATWPVTGHYVADGGCSAESIVRFRRGPLHSSTPQAAGTYPAADQPGTSPAGLVGPSPAAPQHRVLAPRPVGCRFGREEIPPLISSRPTFNACRHPAAVRPALTDPTPVGHRTACLPRVV